MKRLQNISIFIIAIMLSSCAIIKPGEIGVKQKLGKLDGNTLDQGAHFYNPFTTLIIRTPVRTTNLEMNIDLPSKEGMNINAQISILYNIKPEMVPNLIVSIGSDYEQIIRNVFRSASADVCAQFMAKDMHSGQRSVIEKQISDRMDDVLIKKGIKIETVLMKSILLPKGLYGSIERKLEAEQEALRMQFILERERLEADRKVIEAKGSRDAQKILAEGLTADIIKLRSIEAFKELSNSTGAKIIITDGNAPFLIDND